MLNKTSGSFLAVTIVALLSGCAKKELPADAASTAEAPAAESTISVPHPTPAAPADAEIDLSGVALADGGKTIAEVYAEKDALAGTAVTVRGKVVKTNAMIMDRNWLHIRDGSGAEGTNDLTVTTAAELPAIGTTIVVTGQLALDKEFGMGYQYPVIIEDAEVVVE